MVLVVAERGFTVEEVVEVTPAVIHHSVQWKVAVEADLSTPTKMEKQPSDGSNAENAK